MKYVFVAILVFASFYIGRHSTIWFYPNQINKPHSYLDNPRYESKIQYFNSCSGQYDIVMLGDSHIERMNWNEFLNRSDVANRGINLDISEGVLHRLNSTLSCKPKIVLLMVGANDIFFNTPYSTYISNVSKIVDTLSKKGIKVVMNEVFMCYYKHKGYLEWKESVINFNNGLDSVATSFKIPIIKFNPEKDCLFPDSHLTAKGYNLWKEEIIKYIK